MEFSSEEKSRLIQVQLKQLRQLKTVLTDDAYDELYNYATKGNDDAIRDSQIIRGGDLTTFIYNMGIQREDSEFKAKQLVQYKLQQEIINTLSINIVTCGNCGSVLLHRLSDADIECPDCGYESEACDFPDLNY